MLPTAHHAQGGPPAGSDPAPKVTSARTETLSHYLPEVSQQVCRGAQTGTQVCPAVLLPCSAMRDS